MAITRVREGPLKQGAGPFRLPVKGRKAALFAGLPITLILLVLTFDKTVFLFRLTAATLGSHENGKGYVSAMAGCAYRRPALLPLLDTEAGNPDFLAAWIAEHFRHGESDFGKSGYGPFLERVAARFPENVILESLGFYGDEGAARDRENFDGLFFRLVSDPEFNNLSYRALTESIRDGRLPAKTLRPLLSYLAWMKNPALARELWKWGAGVETTKEALSGFSKEALSPSPAPSPEPGLRAEADEVRASLARLLKIDPARLELGENLIAERDFRDPGSLEKSWEFLDLSGREPFFKGSFAGGIDPQEGAALRVMGFFTKEIPGRVPCRAGFGQRRAIPLGPEIYLFSFRYRTQVGTERPSYWLASLEYIPERELGPTAGRWRRVFYVFKNADLAVPEVKPVLRMWGTGTVWFTDVGLYTLEANGPLLPAGKEILLYE